MTRPPVQDGRPLATGTITAEDVQAELHGRPQSGSVPLTPAQQRAILAEDRWPDDAEPPPGYEHHTVTVRSDRELAERNRTSDAALEGDPKPPQRVADPEKVAEARRQAAQLRKDARHHMIRCIERSVDAQSNGDPERMRRASADARAAMELGDRVKRALGVDEL